MQSPEFKETINKISQNDPFFNLKLKQAQQAYNTSVSDEKRAQAQEQRAQDKYNIDT
jgi:hypothetical protein